MKWIGTQTIYDHVRLNKGITLDSVSITTVQSSGESFVDNDTSLMTSAAIADKIEAYGYSTTAGDITGVTAGTGLSGGGTSGAVTLNVEASQTQITAVGTIATGVWQGTAIGASYVATLNQDTTGTAAEATILETARTIGGVSFDGSGNINLPGVNTAGDQDTSGRAGTVATIAGLAPNTATTQATQGNITSCANLVTVGTIGTGVWQGTGIASGYMASATDSAKGAVELATTGEADTGTDTARAVTPAGLKSHIDARYAFSYLHFACQSTMLSSGNWVGPSGNGLNHHVWNLDYGVNTETNDTSEAAISRIYAQSGIRVPVACVIDGFSGMSRNAGGSRQVTVGLFLARAADSNAVPFGTTSTTRPKLQCHADTNNDGGDYINRAVHYEVTGANLAMAAGDVLYPAIKLTGVTSSGDTDNTYTTITIAFKTLIA